MEEKKTKEVFSMQEKLLWNAFFEEADERLGICFDLARNSEIPSRKREWINAKRAQLEIILQQIKEVQEEGASIPPVLQINL
ncbi:hypothetical protein [Vibrio parahaemolyticus]|uniref:hypothetical protein n=1 Tax=Vibrio parahaemolyticus TaxID=670 RepID=UPI003891ECC3